MGIIDKLFGGPTYDRRKELEEIEAEVLDLQQSIEQETNRFLQELDSISKARRVEAEKQIALFGDDIDRIKATNQSPIATEAELTLLLADVDSESVAQTIGALQQLHEAKLKHDAEMSRLIARRDECYARLEVLGAENEKVLDNIRSSKPTKRR